MNEIKITTEWIEGLKVYTDRVKETVQDNIRHNLAVVSLLGYLDSLEILITSNK